MRTVVLIPGAGGLGWYWHRVAGELEARGYDVCVVDLAAGGRTGLPAYADATVEAIGERRDVALVAQSMGAFTVPLVWQRVRTSAVVFVNPMLPRPGETPGEWWEIVGFQQARVAAARRAGYSPEFDLATYFLHDIPAELTAEMEAHGGSQLDERFDDVCAFESWPAVPTHVVAGREDRFFPLELQQRVARERLGLDPIVVPGGHLCALSHPTELAGVLADCVGAP